jgi:signal transduction histidine kinase
VELASSAHHLAGRDSLDLSSLTFALAAAAGAGLCALSAVLVLSTAGPGDRPLIALGYLVVIGVPIGVGLWAWSAKPESRFGALLVAAGFLWFLPTLAASSSEVVYSIGRVGTWLVQPVLVVVMLAFPSGRLKTGIERALVWVTVLVVAVLYLPSAFIVEQYPLPIPTAPCGVDCPGNAFMLLDAEPGFVDAWLVPVRELLSVLVFAGVVVVLGRRITRATRLMRRTLTPVLVAAAIRAALFVVYLPVREADPSSPLLEGLGWIWLLSLPAIAVAFLLGLLRAELAAGEALQRLALRLRERPDPGELTAVLRDTLEDPALELAYWVPEPHGEWVDAAGTPLAVPLNSSERRLTEVRDNDRRVAGLIHDAALSDQEEFVEAAGSLALAALENQLLAAKVEASLRELSESRARIQAAADNERRRIERDLHDGAQQRLVALRIRLGLAEELMRADLPRGAELLQELGVEAEEALEDVRSLAHGVYPSLLADRGLAEALEALARGGPVATRVELGRIGRYPPEIESAVYFCCLEALQNAAKHASGATCVVISFDDGDGIRLVVRDDGVGFADGSIRAGTGLTNMRDRLEAVGGTLTVSSELGAGTRVTGTIPSHVSTGIIPSGRCPDRPV